MADYFFQTKQLTVGYQVLPVLKDVTIGLNKGEILTLIGPNGAGKSTLLKSIAKQLKPLGGSVYLEQQELAGLSGHELAKKMAVVFTDKLYTEMMTCEEVVASGRYPYTGRFGILSDEDRRIVEESMDMTCVSELKGKDYNKISDGQRQRVLLARALCQQPEIILLDEPTSYLDIRYKLEFLATLQRLAKEKQLSVIMSLHELDMAKRISDRILCIGRDGIERYGTPEEIFTEGYITELFNIRTGSFEDGSTDAELPKPIGEPEVFVLAGSGSGRETFRKLQRAGIAFAVGILYTHDLDYPVAQALAAQVIAVESAEAMGEAHYKEARQMIERCQHVIVCREKFAPWEKVNAGLYRYAETYREKNVEEWIDKQTGKNLKRGE
ncbi:MAG: ABC transporter ATP-binding protein [Lachnospiraceae bacterium]|nr:ABC transporter ATP-binding protein [Lachnospiraceae bacterium]